MSGSPRHASQALPSYPPKERKLWLQVCMTFYFLPGEGATKSSVRETGRSVQDLGRQELVMVVEDSVLLPKVR